MVPAWHEAPQAKKPREPNVTQAMTPAPIDSASRVKLSAHVSLQALGPDEGGVVLRLDSGELFTVNDTTLEFLRGLDGVRTIADLARRMTDVFEVDEETLTADLIEISGELMRESVITLVA